MDLYNTLKQSGKQMGSTIAHISVWSVCHLGERLASVAYIWLRITMIFYIAALSWPIRTSIKSLQTCRHPKTKYEVKWEDSHL